MLQRGCCADGSNDIIVGPSVAFNVVASDAAAITVDAAGAIAVYDAAAFAVVAVATVVTTVVDQEWSIGEGSADCEVLRTDSALRFCAAGH